MEFGQCNFEALEASHHKAAVAAPAGLGNPMEVLLALQKAGAVGASESLWFTVSNHLAGGSTSNALLFKDGTLYSPFARGEEPSGAIPSPARAGVTREALFELADTWCPNIDDQEYKEFFELLDKKYDNPYPNAEGLDPLAGADL